MKLHSTNSSWEIFFSEAALRAEEYIMQFENKNLCPLKIALFEKWLDWNAYSKWFIDKNKVGLLKNQLPLEELFHLQQIYQLQSVDNKLAEPFRSNDCLLLNWEDQFLLLGYTKDTFELMTHFSKEQQQKITFILCHPEQINFIKQTEFTLSLQNDFWDKFTKQFTNGLNNQHSDLRKTYDAICILKINQSKTKGVFIDDDIKSEIENSKSLQFSFRENEFFKSCFLEKKEVQFKCQENSIELLDFKSGFVKPIMLNEIVIGFILGFSLTYENEINASTLKAA